MIEQANIKQFETLAQYLQREGKILLIPKYEIKRLEWPAAPKGKHIPLAPMGCLRLPAYGV